MTARQIKNVNDLAQRAANNEDKDNAEKKQKQQKEIQDGQLPNATSGADNTNTPPSDIPATEATTSTNDEEANEEQNDNTAEQVSELKALKDKIKNYKKEPPKEPATFFLTAENAKRVKAIKGRGMKSKLVNELLDLYFSED